MPPAAGGSHVADGQAEVAAPRRCPACSSTPTTLGSLYLGGVGVEHPPHAGRLTGDAPGRPATWAAMADVGPAPYCTPGF